MPSRTQVGTAFSPYGRATLDGISRLATPEVALLSVFPAHAPEDAPFAYELSAFLESGCDVVCFKPDAAIRPGEDLLSTVERGHAADVVLLLLSVVSNLRCWPARARWEPILLANPAETGTQVAVFLLEECSFPQLLRRGSKFFDAAPKVPGENARRPAMRRLKRWLRGVRTGTIPAMHFSPELEELYRSLADQPGKFNAPGVLAERFAREAALDFDSVLWIPAHGGTLVQIAGELGAQLQMKLEGEIEDNCRRIRAMLSAKRCLLILDAPQVDVEALIPSARTSVLFTTEPVRIMNGTPTLADARVLFSNGRYAEAYELFHQLIRSGADPASCASELLWICESWDRLEEANTLRFHAGPSPSEQLRLF